MAGPPRGECAVAPVCWLGPKNRCMLPEMAHATRRIARPRPVAHLDRLPARSSPDNALGHRHRLHCWPGLSWSRLSRAAAPRQHGRAGPRDRLRRRRRGEPGGGPGDRRPRRRAGGGGPAGGPRAGHGEHARGRVSRARPAAPRGRFVVPQRGDVQPRRILAAVPRRTAELPPLHARAALRPHRHRTRRGPHPGWDRVAGVTPRRLRPLRGADSCRGRDRPAAAGDRPHRAHRLQRAGQSGGEPHPSDHARPRHAGRRGGRFFRRAQRAAAGDHDGGGHDPRRPASCAGPSSRPPTCS
jgi:hypothetical protein